MGRAAPKLPAEQIREFNLILNNWKPGTVTLLEENRTPPGAVVESTNTVQIQDGVWTPKWGSAYYTLPGLGNIDGAMEVVNTDGTTEILEAIAGTLYRSTNGGTKTAVALSNGTLTAGKRVFMKQIRGLVLVTNYTDPIIQYDTTAKTATGHLPLAIPTGLSVTKTGLAGTSYIYYYVVVATNLVGTTVGSTEVSVSVGKDRDSWTLDNTVANTTDFNTLTFNRVPNAVRYSIFVSDQSGFEEFLESIPDPGSGTTVTYKDDGTQAINEFVELPNADTTGGPILGPTELSGNRVWGIGADGAVYWGGVGQYTTTFSSYYGGGYVFLEKGGREKPTSVVHYRDGKGTALATVLSSDPEGNGATWQISLDTVTVGTTSFIVPSTTKIVGSIGCSSPFGVAKVNDDIIFGNGKGAFSLGSQPSLLNVLATRELSANIRTSWRALAGPAMKSHANYYYDAKLFWALPNASAANSEIWIRNTELQNWQLAWKGIAISSFFEYSDPSGRTHLLGVPVAGTQLIEFSSDIKTDLGVTFSTRIKTGILPVDKNHNTFAQVDNIFAELGKVQGLVYIDVYGYDYRKGFGFLKRLTITGGTSSTAQWGQLWSTHNWSYIGQVPTSNAVSILRKRLRLNKLVNNLQFVVSTNDPGSWYELLELAASGFLVDVDAPSNWKKTTSVA